MGEMLYCSDSAVLRPCAGCYVLFVVATFLVRHVGESYKGKEVLVSMSVLYIL